MSTTVTVGGSNYFVPAYNETGWAQGTGNLSQLLVALAAVSGLQSSVVQFVTAASSPVTVTSQKTYLANTASLAITFNLPAASSNIWFAVKDSGYNSLTNAITIHRNGSEQINGVAADLTLQSNGGYWFFGCDGTNWWLLGSGNPSSYNNGLIVTTPDGLHTYRIAVDNDGSITTEALT